MYRIATTTTQNREPQLPHASRNTNPHVSKSSGVNHTTSVSRPQLKCYQVKDKVVPNNSQVKFKKKEVEDHHRISSISKKTKSVTVCNDSSNSRTSNVNAVSQVDQESQIKMIQVKEMMQDNDLKSSKSKDKGSRSRSQSMNEQSHYKQDKTKTRQSINVKSHIFNVIGGTEEFEERDLNIGGDC
ncbi:hypothetical protein Tco_0067213 [Tanacetum coccineum]